MKRFINEKIAIKCETNEELNYFLKRCEKEGLKWFSGAKPTDFIPSILPCYIYYNRYGNNELLCGETYPCKWKPITYKDYFKIEEITITRYDNKVVAKYGDKVGVAKCNQDDEFNFEIGAKLAFDRLFDAEDDDIPNRRIVKANERVIDNYLKDYSIEEQRELLSVINWTNDNCTKNLEELGWVVERGIRK